MVLVSGEFFLNFPFFKDSYLFLVSLDLSIPQGGISTLVYQVFLWFIWFNCLDIIIILFTRHCCCLDETSKFPKAWFFNGL